jgi:hypothetical protein
MRELVSNQTPATVVDELIDFYGKRFCQAYLKP